MSEKRHALTAEFKAKVAMEGEEAQLCSDRSRWATLPPCHHFNAPKNPKGNNLSTGFVIDSRYKKLAQGFVLGSNPVGVQA